MTIDSFPDSFHEEVRMRARAKQPIRNLYHARQQCARLLLAAQEAGLPLIADYGTLLGLVRHGDLMAHDTDLDFSVMVTGRSLLAMPEWHAFLAIVHKQGMFVRQHRSRAAHVVGMGGGVTADLFHWFRDEAEEGRWIRKEYRKIDAKHNKGRYLWSGWVESTIAARVTGRGWQTESVPIPWMYDQILEHRYGAGWLTPKAHHDSLPAGPWEAPATLDHIDPPYIVRSAEIAEPVAGGADDEVGEPDTVEPVELPTTRAQYIERLRELGIEPPPRARLAELAESYQQAVGDP